MSSNGSTAASGGNSGNAVMISGVRVPFPEGRKPFPQQLGIMQKIIAGCIRSEHALLESPTGTGKTLALLCASLAWQRKNAIDGADSYGKALLKYEEEMRELQRLASSSDDVKPSPAIVKAERVYDDNDSDFESSPFLRKNRGERMATSSPDTETSIHEKLEPVPPSPYVKIFYSSRTHSQLKQVVTELKRCSPELLVGPEMQNPGLRMCVLGSRDLYCVNPQVASKKGNERNDNCKNKVTFGGCEWHKQHIALAHRTLNDIQDIEEFTREGKRMVACPYYASKIKSATAHISFLPYNYLLDPGIRNALKLGLSGSVVIFDEAHNIEDVCRESASLELGLHNFNAVSEALLDVRDKYPWLAPEVEILEDLVSSLCNWASERPLATGDNYLTEKDGIVLQGPEALASWENEFGLQINAQSIEPLRGAYMALEKAESERAGKHQEGIEFATARNKTPEKEVVSMWVLNFLDLLLSRLEFLVQNRFENARDFRIAVISRYVSVTSGTASNGKHVEIEYEDDGEGKKPKWPRASGSERFFCIWCMNPAIAFRPIKEAARAIVLTSGTLSPLRAFAAELGCEFKHMLEASHVCDIRNQLFASSFQVSGSELLDATFRNAERFQYLSALGDAVLTIIKETPGGALVFFPSYTMLDRCMNRWHQSGIWGQINERKPVYVESRGSSQAFERTITEYREQCKTSKGAIFFAVFRGKLSEGIDFKDEAARAVIIVGIPYPNVKDVVVGLKKAHQDGARKRCPPGTPADHLPLSGQEWYTQQAYRALNQALGRIIRHRYDYGSVILLDYRFGQKIVVENLSKWMRSSVINTYSIEDAVVPLRSFFDRLEKYPPGTSLSSQTMNTPLDVAEPQLVSKSMPSTGYSSVGSGTFSTRPLSQDSSGDENITSPVSASYLPSHQTLTKAESATKRVQIDKRAVVTILSDSDNEEPRSKVSRRGKIQSGRKQSSATESY